MTQTSQASANSPILPPLVGADVEFGNFIQGLVEPRETGAAAARLLLAEIEGTGFNYRTFPLFGPENRGDTSGGGTAGNTEFADGNSDGRGEHEQDSGRKFLSSTGGCGYIDLNHLELPTPEVLDPLEFVATWHAAVRIARQAAAAVNRRLRPGLRVQVLANNSDGLGHSYGSHLSFLIGRSVFDDLFHRRMHQLLFLASFQVSSMVFAGQGKVGAENDRPAVPFQLSQRADFFETLCGEQTTYRRPLVNSRDESLCGRTYRGDHPTRYARLHCIFHDSNLCHVANFLKVGTLQLMLVLIAAGRIDLDLILDQPLDAVVRWSHDPELQAQAETVAGRGMTAVEHQLRMLELAEAYHDEGGFEGLVPRAEMILRRWREVLESLGRRDFAALFGVLDWVTKRRYLQRALERRPQLTWQSPELKHLDHLYANVAPEEGLYWTCERQGLAETLVTDEEIEHYGREPPEGTRAWTRAYLLRIGGAQVESVDWDVVRFRLRDEYGYSIYRTVWLPDPLRFTKSDTGHLFTGHIDLPEIVDRLSEPSLLSEKEPSHVTSRTNA